MDLNCCCVVLCCVGLGWVGLGWVELGCVVPQKNGWKWEPARNRNS